MPTTAAQESSMPMFLRRTLVSTNLCLCAAGNWLVARRDVARYVSTIGCKGALVSRSSSGAIEPEGTRSCWLCPSGANHVKITRDAVDSIHPYGGTSGSAAGWGGVRLRRRRHIFCTAPCRADFLRERSSGWGQLHGFEGRTQRGTKGLHQGREAAGSAAHGRGVRPVRYSCAAGAAEHTVHDGARGGEGTTGLRPCPTRKHSDAGKRTRPGCGGIS